MEEGDVRKNITWIYLDLLRVSGGVMDNGRVWLLARAVQDGGRDT
jgi:hypothetical protein